MADIANIGFRVDTSQLDAARQKVGQLFTDIGNLSNSTTRVDTAVTNTAQRVTQGADKQIQAYARTRKAIDDAAQQAQVAAQAQVQAMAQIGVSVTGVADRVDNSTARQVAAHGRTRKSVDQLRNLHQAGLLMISKGFMDLTDKVENSTQRQVAAHGRTRNAMQKMATESRNAANTQIEVLRKIASETEKMSRAVANSLHNQKVQTQLLGRAMLDLNNGVRTSVTGKQLLNQTLVDSTQKTQGFRVALLGTANAVAVLDGPLGGVASRISSFGILVGRFGVAGGALAASIAGITLASKAAVAEFNKMETAVLRLDRVVELAGGRIAGTGGQIYGMASDLAFATLEDVEGSLAGINNIIGLSAVNADNMGRIMSNAADLSAMGFGDLASMAQVLGRAVQDPERAMSRLNRRMNLFTESEIEVIKLMAEMGKESEALDMFLAKIESRFEGISKTGSALPYALDTLGQAVPRLMAAMGGDILKATGLDKAITWLANKAQEAATKTDIRQGTASLETQEQFALKQALELRKQLNVEEQRSGRFRSESKIAELKTQIQVWDDLAASASAAAEAQAKAAEASSRQEELVANAKAVKNMTELLKEQNRVRQEMSPDEIRQQDLREQYGLAGAGETVMVEDQLVNVDEALKDLDQQNTFKTMREDAAKLVSETDNLTARNQLLAKSMLDLENMDTREAQLRVMQAELEGVPELAGAYDLVTDALNRYIESRDERDAGVVAQREARTMDRIGDAIRNQIGLVRIQNNQQKLTTAELLVQQFIQAKISEMRGQMSVEDVLRVYGEEVDALREQLILSTTLAGLTGVQDNAEQTLRTLQAQQVVMGQLGVRTERNGILYDAMVAAVAEQLKLQEEGVLSAEDLAVKVDEIVNSTHEAASAAQILANNMANATTQAQAYAGTLRSVQSGVITDEDRTLQAREYVRLRREGASAIDAEVGAFGAVTRAQLERNRATKEGADLAADLATEEALVQDAMAGRREALTAVQEQTDLEKSLREAMKETNDTARSGTDDFAKRVEASEKAIAKLKASLDPAVAAAAEFAEEVGVVNEALDLGVISIEEHIDLVRQLADQYELAKDPVRQFYEDLGELMENYNFAENILGATQDAFTDLLSGQYDEMETFGDAVRAMGKSVADTIRQQAAEALSAWAMQKIMTTFNIGGLGGDKGDGGAAALNSAGMILQGSGRALSGSAMALTRAAAALSAGGVGGDAAAMAAQAAVGGGSGSWLGNLASSIFGGFFDQGGYIAPGKVGIAGERGPELIAGPANVVSRTETARVTQAPKPEVNQKIINVLDPSIVSDYLSSGEGEEVVLNVMRRNGMLG